MYEKINVYLSPSPLGLEKEYRTLLTSEAVEFLIDLSLKFQDKIDDLYAARFERKCRANKKEIPKFVKFESADDNWRVAPVGERLKNRHLDLGDVSPSDYSRFTNALNSRVQGIQVDFDDGHCPSWKNQIHGLYNVYRAVRNQIPNVPIIDEAPVLMLRPRAWNMLEHNVSVSGKIIPGTIFDFALLMFHNARVLANKKSGPFFYLSKLESASEAKLWNDMFVWSQNRLGLPYATIKACVLIENILAVFEMDRILYELRYHVIGLNCGIWDYAASIITKFGDDSRYVLPDRNKYVDIDKTFLKNYMKLIVRICRKRGAIVTGGMSAKILPIEVNDDFNKIVQEVVDSKKKEILIGVDGFMVYDLKLVEFMNELWEKKFESNVVIIDDEEEIKEIDLLKLPIGGVTLKGLCHNITVGMLFVYHWLVGDVGVFPLNDSIEDSATAEISRAQIWQWIRHSAVIEDDDKIVTRQLVYNEAVDIYKKLITIHGIDNEAKIKLTYAFDIFLRIVNQRDFPDFITTYLNDAHIFYHQVQANL